MRVALGRFSGATSVLAAIVGASAVGGLSCGDPVHDAEVAALGPEANGVSPGPTHRPGQPCLTCHGGLGPASQTFVTAGTIYTSAYDPKNPTAAPVPLANGTVHLVDATGTPLSPDPVINAAGNFFVTTDQWSPVFPLGGLGPQENAAALPHDISVIAPGSTFGSATAVTNQMSTQIARGGVYASCAYCHFDPPGPTSPGHVWLM